MDIIVVLLTFFCTYVIVIFILLIIARLMFPKVEIADDAEPKVKQAKNRTNKRIVNSRA